MQKPDKLYSYADFQDGFKEAALNTQNLVPFFKIDPKTHKNIMRFMAGPGGAEINGNRMHGGDLTGQYVVDAAQQPIQFRIRITSISLRQNRCTKWIHIIQSALRKALLHMFNGLAQQ